MAWADVRTCTYSVTIDDRRTITSRPSEDCRFKRLRVDAEWNINLNTRFDVFIPARTPTQAKLEKSIYRAIYYQETCFL